MSYLSECYTRFPIDPADELSTSQELPLVAAQRDMACAEVDRLRADLAKAQGLIDFLNQPLPVNSRTALIERCYQVQLICETIPAHENQTKTALALSDLVDAIRKSGGRGETLADLQRARADAERAKADNEQLRQHLVASPDDRLSLAIADLKFVFSWLADLCLMIETTYEYQPLKRLQEIATAAHRLTLAHRHKYSLKTRGELEKGFPDLAYENPPANPCRTVETSDNVSLLRERGERAVLEAALTAAHSRIAELEREKEGLRDVAQLILPMAKGYAAAHPVGNNQAMVNEAVAALTPGATEGDKL